MEKGRKALDYAIGQGNAAMMSLLIENGARVDLPDRNARTALHIATSRERVKVLQVLLAVNSGDMATQTAYVNMQDSYVSNKFVV